jgi:glycosyltransferase involved in cell wall biosynthesis
MQMTAHSNRDQSAWQPRTPVGPDSRPWSIAIYMPSLAGGGAERQCISLAGKLHGAGLRVTLVLNRVQGAFVDEVPAGIHVVGLNGRRTLHDIVLLARFLRREQPDLLLTNLDHNNIAGCLAKLVAASRTKVIIYQHNALAREFASAERWTYHLIPLGYRLLSPCMAAAVGVSDGIARELVGSAGLSRNKVVTIHNIVIRDGLLDRSAEQIDHPWLSDRSTPLFVTAGRLVPQKDHETLLNALALHRRSGGNARLLILGSGPLDDVLKRHAAALGLETSVCFVGFRANPLPWLRHADVFVLSSRSEGFGNVLVEAMACGTPVIATDCDHGPREILEDGRYGVLVPPRDPRALARAFDTARDLRTQFPPDILRARAAAFTSAACTASFLSLFETLLRPNRCGRRTPLGGLTLASVTADTSSYHRRSNELQD